MKTPRGFSFAGIHAGIKATRKDLALVASDVPCAAAGCFTSNLARAAPVVDAAARLPGEGMRAIVVHSGNANGLTGASGLEDVRALRAAVGAALGVPSESVLSAATGVLGVRLPIAKLVAAARPLVEARGAHIEQAAEAIMTTDTQIKLTQRSFALDGTPVSIAAVAKGSGMVAPQLSTVIAIVTTDARLGPDVLQQALVRAVDQSFNNLNIDGEMSTNDAVIALANGLAANASVAVGSAEYETFCEALTSLCVELARAVAEDGEGATKLIQVRIEGAPDAAIAHDLARTVVGSPLVKAAMFGADPNWGRVLATVGARAGARCWPVDPLRATVCIQGERVFADGAPAAYDAPSLRAKMREPQVTIDVKLVDGTAGAIAWGCDLSYDYVKINADYASQIHASKEGVVSRDDRLTNYSPSFKRTLLVEALSYISRFARTRAVIKYGGAAMVRESLKASFASDINLLRSAGLLPIVVHGGGPELTRTLEALGGRQAEVASENRFTSADDLKVVEMVLTGRINAELVSLLNHQKAHAVGISGKDAGLLRARKLLGEDGRDLGMVGEVTSVNHELIEVLLSRQYVPVVSPIGLGEDGEGYHLNGDAAAAEIAIALRAEKLIYLTDVPGILDKGELISELTASELRAKVDAGVVRGGMVAKARSVLRALDGGVKSVHVIDGRTPHGLIAELFTDRGVGTLVVADA